MQDNLIYCEGMWSLNSALLYTVNMICMRGKTPDNIFCIAVEHIGTAGSRVLRCSTPCMLQKQDNN